MSDGVRAVTRRDFARRGLAGVVALHHVVGHAALGTGVVLAGCGAGETGSDTAGSNGSDPNSDSTGGSVASSTGSPGGSDQPGGSGQPGESGQSGDSGSGLERDENGRIPFIRRGRSGRAEVALTFHVDGDPDLATALLDGLAEHDLVITAFLIGSWAEQNPVLARRFVEDGHELANHTWSHPDLSLLAPEAVRSEIQKCAAVITDLTGTKGRWFRPSQTEEASDVVRDQAGAVGYEAAIGYSVDSLDFLDPGSSIVEEEVAKAGRGDIVSLHFGHRNTIEALPALARGLVGRGLTAVRVSDLLA